MPRTKIIGTIGPASDSAADIKKMIKAGMDVARLNLSHNNHRYHYNCIQNIRMASKITNYPVPIIIDLQGPKIRTGQVSREGVKVKKGDKVILIPEEKKIPITKAYLYIPIQIPGLYKLVKKNQLIYIDDALVELKVLSIEDGNIECIVRNDGAIKTHKGINIPGVNTKLPALSAKDIDDLEFGIKNKVDYIALSYVDNDKDILDLRKIILKLEKKYGYRSIDYKKPKSDGKWSGIHTRIVAKIERPQAVKNFNKILEATDAVMIARGDLGLEMPLEDLPLAQKDIINKCLRANKPVIVATQMLNSMIENPYPTRAEVSDVANAILDGADAIMLSGETATGKYPLKAIRIMDKIAKEVEPEEIKIKEKTLANKNGESITASTAVACKELAEKVGAKLIVCTTTSGLTARSIATLKPKQKILAFCPSELTEKQLNLSWGVYPHHLKKIKSFDKLIVELKGIISRKKLANKGDKIIICSSHPLGYIGETNLIKIETL